jgi:Mrp family chromosome partitioning ATPase
VGEHPVVTLSEPDGHAAEAFRLVRTNLDFMSVDADVRSLLVTSSVQGEGKSVTVANLAVAMALAGKKVVIVDGDLRRPRQHQYFGLANDHGVSTVTTEQGSLASAIQKVELTGAASGANGVDFAQWASGGEAMSRLYVLTSGPLPPNPGEIVASRRFAGLIEALLGEADIVLVDSPALLAVGDTAALASKVDGLVFLADMHVATKPMLQQAAEQLAKLPCEPLGIIVRTEHERGRGRYYSTYSSGYTYSQTGSKREAQKGKPAVRASDQIGTAVAARTETEEVVS